VDALPLLSSRHTCRYRIVIFLHPLPICTTVCSRPSATYVCDLQVSSSSSRSLFSFPDSTLSCPRLPCTLLPLTSRSPVPPTSSSPFTFCHSAARLRMRAAIPLPPSLSAPPFLAPHILLCHALLSPPRHPRHPLTLLPNPPALPKSAALSSSFSVLPLLFTPNPFNLLAITVVRKACIS
jgi:hypothetical protein